MTDETATLVEDLARRERIVWPSCFTALGLSVLVQIFNIAAFACTFVLWVWAMTTCFILQNRIARGRGRR